MKTLNLRALFSYLTSPITLGIVATFFITFFAYEYYEARKLTYFDWDSNTLLKIVKIADNKSYDLRLESRGPRPGSPDVALLVIDEKAVSAIGRWPWPREVMAQATDKALELGAKVVAFDVVFGEASAKPAHALFKDMVTKKLISKKHQSTILNELKKYDSDLIFSKTIREHATKIVLGNFYENGRSDYYGAGHISACKNIIFEQSPAFEIWDNEEQRPIPSGRWADYIPDTLLEIYQERLKTIDESIRSQRPHPKNQLEKYELDKEIISEKAKYCSNWLSDKKDEINNIDPDDLNPMLRENWSAIKEQEGEGFTYNSFDEWRAHFINNSPPLQTESTMDWVMNTPLLASGGLHNGYFNAQLDDDGTIRRSRLVVRSGLDHYMSSIALKAFLLGNKYSLKIQIDESPNPYFNGITKLSVFDPKDDSWVFDIPVDSFGNLMINYAGRRHMFPHVSLAELFTESDEMDIEIYDLSNPNNQTFNCLNTTSSGVEGMSYCTVKKSDFMKGKYFVLGATAIGIFDLRVTPFDENYPGAETHANVIDNLIRRDFLRFVPSEEYYMLLFLIIAGVLYSILLNYLGALFGMIWTIGSITGAALVDKYYFFSNGTVISIVFPLMLIFGLYVVITFYKYFTEEKNKRALRSTFSKYVSPAIVNEILHDPKNIELGGRKEIITVFFSDIRGFTTISEKLDPRALSDLLNSYLTPMTDLVFENRGTLDKYMGDAIMAFFGAPIHYPDHAKYACRCALAQLVKLKELQKEYAEKGLPLIDIGIGLNTGECSVGNMGSRSVRSYTVMGDSVNLGSRLEGINKQYGTRIIISEFTYAEIKDEFICREVDWVRVKGKALPVKIYELVAENKAPDQVLEVIYNFKHGYSLYHQRAFQDALNAFSKALNINPEDSCSQLYLKRCQDYIQIPPPKDWDGVFVMTSK